MALAIVKGAGLALVACSLGQVMADPEETSCFVKGRGYNDPTRNSTFKPGTPNGLFQTTALLCQQLCNRTAYCDKFTWYNNSLGCWLQGSHDTEIESPNAVSGPVVCPKTTKDREIETDAETETGNKTDKEFTTVADKETKKEDGGFPFWIIALGVLALLACCAAAWYFMSSGSEKKKKKKTTAKTLPTERQVEEGAPLVAAGEAAPAPAPLQAASVYYAPQAQAASPMMMMSGAQVASPVSYSVAAPQVSVAAPQYVQTTSRQMMMPIAQPMQAPAQMVYTQPAANALFDQFDADGNGVLSREEMEAGMASLQQQQQMQQ